MMQLVRFARLLRLPRLIVGGVLTGLGVLGILAVTGRLGNTYAWFERFFEPGVWEAMATWTIAIVAIVAGIYAKRQVDLAKRTREELAQPNVALYAELKHTDMQIIEIVVKNFGNTPAYHITFDFKGNPLKRCPIAPGRKLVPTADVVDLYFPNQIAYLAPGQEWRTVWDDCEARREYMHSANEAHPEGPPAEKLLVKRHDVLVEFEDIGGRKLPKVPCVIDFEIYDETLVLNEQNMNHLVAVISALVQTQTALLQQLPARVNGPG